MPGRTLAGFTPLLLRFLPPPSLSSYPPPLSEPSPLSFICIPLLQSSSRFVPLLSPCLSIHSLSFMISLFSCLLSTCFIFFPLTLLTPSLSSASLSSFLLPSIFIFYCNAWLKQCEHPSMTPMYHCRISHSKIIGITVLKKIIFLEISSKNESVHRMWWLENCLFTTSDLRSVSWAQFNLREFFLM